MGPEDAESGSPTSGASFACSGKKKIGADEAETGESDAWCVDYVFWKEIFYTGAFPPGSPLLGWRLRLWLCRLGRGSGR